jgi:hypothetical protein
MTCLLVMSDEVTAQAVPENSGAARLKKAVPLYA